MYLLFQKILLIHTNLLIPSTHPYVWFKLSYECFRVPFLPLYLLFWPFWGLFTHIGVSKTWPHKKDVHHFWSLHPPWQYAPSVGLKHDTNGNFLALGLTWIPKMGGWLLYYTLFDVVSQSSTQHFGSWWLIWSIQNDAKILKNDLNHGLWLLIWEYSATAFKLIPTWQGVDGL